MSDTIVACRSFVGVDLHKTTVTLVAVAPDGKEIARLTINTKCREKIKAWLLALPRPLHLAVEAVGFVEWFIECFRSCVDRIDIADATELSNRRGKRRKVVQLIELQRQPLRWAIIEAIRQRLIRKTGGIKAKANTAMGRRLLRLLYAIVRDGKPYQPGPSRHRNAAANKARAAKRARKNRKEAA